MAFIAQTAFEPRMWNNRNNDLQSIPGLYGAVDGDGDFVPADASAGLLVNKGDHLAEGGYQMTLAADGTADVYACHPTDVQRVGVNGNTYAVGRSTLGLGIPAGTKDTYTKCIPGETYAFGPGNFSTLVTTTNKYATIVNGLLVGSSTEPAAGTGIYFVLDSGLGIDSFIEGNGVAFARYNLLCCKATEYVNPNP